MIKLGWIFPGQASQYVGMGKDFMKTLCWVNLILNWQMIFLDVI